MSESERTSARPLRGSRNVLCTDFWLLQWWVFQWRYVLGQALAYLREEQGRIINKGLSQIFLTIWSTKLNCFTDRVTYIPPGDCNFGSCTETISTPTSRTRLGTSLRGFWSDPHNTMCGKNYYSNFQRRKLSLKERGPLSHHTADRWPRLYPPHVAAAIRLLFGSNSANFYRH